MHFLHPIALRTAGSDLATHASRDYIVLGLFFLIVTL
jgi:hypothetical protein